MNKRKPSTLPGPRVRRASAAMAVVEEGMQRRCVRSIERRASTEHAEPSELQDQLVGLVEGVSLSVQTRRALRIAEALSDEVAGCCAVLRGDPSTATEEVVAGVQRALTAAGTTLRSSVLGLPMPVRRQRQKWSRAARARKPRLCLSACKPWGQREGELRRCQCPY